MKILITGANGQLGRSIQRVAQEYPEFSFIYTTLPEGDITNRGPIEHLVDEQGVELIVNCAAYTAVDRAESEPELAMEINCEGVANLATICAERGVVLIHISTDYIFGGEGLRPIRESDNTSPLSVYGLSKRDGERAMEQTGCKGAIIRTGWLYSEYGSNFVKTMLRLGVEQSCGGSAEQGKIKVVYDQIGTPTYAEDLARAVLEIATRGVEQLEIYHYSNEGLCSWYDFAQAVFMLSKMDVSVEAIESSERVTAAKRPKYSVLSKAKIKKLGINPPFWLASLRDCLERIATGEGEE